MDYSDKKRRPMSEAMTATGLGEEARAFVRGEPLEKPPPSGPAPGEAQEPLLGTISVSVRVPARLALALARTAALRKLRRERPFSQQDIVAEALAQWLREHNSEP
jgi:hypothetical protein